MWIHTWLCTIFIQLLNTFEHKHHMMILDGLTWLMFLIWLEHFTCDGDRILEVFNVDANQCHHIFVFLPTQNCLKVHILVADKWGFDVKLYSSWQKIRKWFWENQVARHANFPFIWELQNTTRCFLFIQQHITQNTTHISFISLSIPITKLPIAIIISFHFTTERHGSRSK